MFHKTICNKLLLEAVRRLEMYNSALSSAILSYKLFSSLCTFSCEHGTHTVRALLCHSAPEPCLQPLETICSDCSAARSIVLSKTQVAG